MTLYLRSCKIHTTIFCKRKQKHDDERNIQNDETDQNKELLRPDCPTREKHLLASKKRAEGNKDNRKGSRWRGGSKRHLKNVKRLGGKNKF